MSSTPTATTSKSSTTTGLDAHPKLNDIGFAAVDTGDLATGGRLQQAGSELYARVITEAEAPGLLRDLP
jgi:hypothetical protein